jgi:threonine/homoserine/homoserine lactone efflux protein
VFSYLTLGATYAFAAAVQPGPYQAYLVSQALSHGWRSTLPAALAPILSDAPIIAVVLLALSQVPPRVGMALRAAGGLFLLYLAWRAFRRWQGYRAALEDRVHTARRSLLSAAMVNLLNPNPWLGWSLVLGPLLLESWRAAPLDGVALLVAFYGTMVAASAGIIVLFARARRFGPRVARALVGVSAVALACFGGFQTLSALLWAIEG